MIVLSILFILVLIGSILKVMEDNKPKVRIPYDPIEGEWWEIEVSRMRNKK